MPPTNSDLRLRNHADFQLVYKSARKQHAREMSFFFRLRSEEVAPFGPRIGLTVGKVLGKAHDRNRIKRRLRAAVRRHAPVLSRLPVDVVLHPRRSALTMEWTRLEAEVGQVFRTVVRLIEKQAASAPARTATGPVHTISCA